MIINVASSSSTEDHLNLSNKSLKRLLFGLVWFFVNKLVNTCTLYSKGK